MAMPSPDHPAVRVLLRAALLGTGVVGGYLLLSLFAGPANADSGLLGDAFDGVADTGIDLGGVIEELPVPELGPPPERVETVPAERDPPDADSGPPPDADSGPVPDTDSGPAADADSGPAPEAEPAEPEPAADHVESVAPVVRDAGDLTGAVTEPVAGTASPLPAVGSLVVSAGHSVDHLVTGLADTVESTVSPLTSSVDPLVSGFVPVVDEATEAATSLATPLPLPLNPVALIEYGPAPSGAVPILSTASTDLPAARDGPDPPGDPPVPARPPPRPAASDAPNQASAEPAAAGAGPAPVPARPVYPLPSTRQVSGQSFDHAHPWPLTRPSNVAVAPDIGLRCCVEDVTYTGLVMPVSAPPG
jgi:hypothetical protein